MEKTRHRNIAMIMAAILLCLVLVTTSIVGGMLARFVSSSGERQPARVAKFAVTGSGFSETINIGVTMNPGDTKGVADGLSFLVTNKSEVSVRYTVTLRNMTNNLPLELNVSGAEAADLAKFKTAEGYKYVATLPPNSDAAAQNFEFELTWPTGEDYPGNTDIVYSGQLDNIAVTVTAEQID